MPASDGGAHTALTDAANGRHLSLQFKDDVLIGCNSVGWTDHVGVMRGLVEGKVKLGAWKDRLLQDPRSWCPPTLPPRSRRVHGTAPPTNVGAEQSQHR